MNQSILISTAVAATVALGYAACTAIFWLSPEASITFMDGLFHGLDLRKLQNVRSMFDLGTFLTTLLVMSVWSLLLASLFQGLLAALGRHEWR